MRHRSIITAILLSTALAPPASAQDFRTPDARDQPPVKRAVGDLRSPDAREVDGAPAAQLEVDLRSPDARGTGEAAARRAADARAEDVRELWSSPPADVYAEAFGSRASAPTGAAVPARAVTLDDGGGFDFGFASIVALALALAGAGAGMVVALRRRRAAAPIGS